MDIASLIGLTFLSWLSLTRWLLLLELTIYTMALFVAAVLSSFQQRKFYLLIGLPLSIATMHLAWGGGFLWSMITSFVENRKHV